MTADKEGKEEKRGKRRGRCIRQVAIQVETRIKKIYVIYIFYIYFAQRYFSCGYLFVSY